MSLIIAVHAPRSLDWAPWEHAKVDDSIQLVRIGSEEGLQAVAELRGVAQAVITSANIIDVDQLVEAIEPEMALCVNVTELGHGEWVLPMDDQFKYRSKHRIESESFGSLVAQTVALSIASKVQFAMPKRTHGPGARTQADETIVLWARGPLFELGVRLKGDNPVAVNAVYASQRGSGFVPFRPGYPGVIPTDPLSFGDSFTGKTHSGALADLGVQGFRVLEIGDLLTLLGYPADLDFTWNELSGLLAVSTASVVIEWLYQTLPRR